jgi:hypothetical protein
MTIRGCHRRHAQAILTQSWLAYPGACRGSCYPRQPCPLTCKGTATPPQQIVIDVLRHIVGRRAEGHLYSRLPPPPRPGDIDAIVAN